MVAAATGSSPGAERHAAIQAERRAAYMATRKWLDVLVAAHAVGWWPEEKLLTMSSGGGHLRAAVTDPALRNRLGRLARLAEQLRGQHEADDPRRAASEELTSLLADLYRHGYSIRGLDEACGYQEGTVRRRLLRHGYWPGGDSPGYDRVDRYQGRPDDDGPSRGRALDQGALHS